VLEKQVQEVSDLNAKEYDGAQQEVSECEDKYNKCLGHYLDLLHLCNGKTMDIDEPINHTKLLGELRYNFKDFL
jgi:hypothetical protein